MLPPLEWISGFTASISRAIGSTVSARVDTTVNPLIFRVRVLFSEPLSGRNMMLVWNLFQMYAVKNDSVPHGKKAQAPQELVAEVIVKRRLGSPRSVNPAE